MTLAGFGFTVGVLVSPAAQYIAAMMSESVPPHLPSTRTGSTITLRPTLAMPTLLSVAAPTRPAVWVPCQLLLLALVPVPHSRAVV